MTRVLVTLWFILIVATLMDMVLIKKEVRKFHELYSTKLRDNTNVLATIKEEWDKAKNRVVSKQYLEEELDDLQSTIEHNIEQRLTEYVSVPEFRDGMNDITDKLDKTITVIEDELGILIKKE